MPVESSCAIVGLARGAGGEFEAPAILGVLAPRHAWERLRDMQQVVDRQLAIAHAIRCLPLYGQLELTLG